MTTYKVSLRLRRCFVRRHVHVLADNGEDAKRTAEYMNYGYTAYYARRL